MNGYGKVIFFINFVVLKLCFVLDREEMMKTIFHLVDTEMTLSCF